MFVFEEDKKPWMPNFCHWSFSSLFFSSPRNSHLTSLSCPGFSESWREWSSEDPGVRTCAWVPKNKQVESLP